MSEFNRIRRETIINVITQTLNEKMNNHNRYADIMGVTYNFSLPQINASEWMNAVDDISIMAFVQGVPVGQKSYYNSYALGASRIMQTEYIYATNQDFSDKGAGESTKLYHKRYCECVVETKYELDDYGEFVLDEDGEPIISNSTEATVTEIFVNRFDAAEAGYYPCRLCKP